MIKKGVAAAILALLALSGCGRREERSAFDAPSPKEAPPSLSKALPETAFAVRWAPVKLPAQLTPGELVPVEVTFTNIGDTTWPDVAMGDPKAKSGANAVRLSYSLVPNGKTGATPQRIGERSDLTKPLAPGESATLQIHFRAPEQPGDYKVTFELLQELVVWFSDKGAETLTVPVRVVSATAGAAPKGTP